MMILWFLGDGERWLERDAPGAASAWENSARLKDCLLEHLRICRQLMPDGAAFRPIPAGRQRRAAPTRARRAALPRGLGCSRGRRTAPTCGRAHTHGLYITPAILARHGAVRRGDAELRRRAAPHLRTAPRGGRGHARPRRQKPLRPLRRHRGAQRGRAPGPAPAPPPLCPAPPHGGGGSCAAGPAGGEPRARAALGGAPAGSAPPDRGVERALPAAAVSIGARSGGDAGGNGSARRNPVGGGGQWARPRRLSDPIALRCGFRSRPPELPAASLARLLENSVPLAVAAPRSRSVGGTWRGAAVPPRHLSVPFQKAFPIPAWLRRDRLFLCAIPLLVGGRRCWKFQRGPRDNGNELGAAPAGFGDPAGARLRAHGCGHGVLRTAPGWEKVMAVVGALLEVLDCGEIKMMGDRAFQNALAPSKPLRFASMHLRISAKPQPRAPLV